MDAFNPIPPISPCRTPGGSIDPLAMDTMSAPSTPFGEAPSPFVAPSTPLGGQPPSPFIAPSTPLSGQPPSPFIAPTTPLGGISGQSFITPTTPLGGGGGIPSLPGYPAPSPFGNEMITSVPPQIMPPTPPPPPQQIQTPSKFQGGNSSIKMEMPPPTPPTNFQYQISTPSTAGASGGATPPTFSFPGGSSIPRGDGGNRDGGSGSDSDASSGETSGVALSDLLMQLEDYAPTIPDSAANHYLHQAGFETVDPRMSRLMSLAAQKFISDVVNEAFTQCKLKGQANLTSHQKASKVVKDKKYTLTMEDLVPVLNDNGITIKKPPYYT